jgi:hypothetical protein
MLGGVEVDRLAFPPSAIAVRFRDHERDRGALQVLAVVLDEDPAGLAEPGNGHAARLVQLQRLEEAGDQRRPQVRLVVDERIREGEVRGGGLRDPRGELLRGRSV